MQLLLENGANDNTRPVSSNGHEETMNFLLDKDADVDIQTGYYGRFLPATSPNCHEEVVQLPL